MPPESFEPSGPVAATFAGDSPAQIAKRSFHATRPKFFPASVLPVIAGTAWGYGASLQFDIVVFLLALLATVCVHAASNALNDVGDDASGTDRHNDDRIYPYTGGSRFIQEGIMDGKSMLRLGTALLVTAALAGLALLAMKGIAVLAFGLCGVALGVLYSLGPLRLSALGLGESAVAVAFGVLPVCGAAWLQSGVVDAGVLMFSLPVSAWVAAILLINEVPDVAPDAACGKRTLPVRLGPTGTAALYVLIQLLAVSLIALLTVRGQLPLLAPLVPALLLVGAFRGAGAIRRGISDRAGLTRAIEATLANHTLGTLWLTACVLYAAWWPAG